MSAQDNTVDAAKTRGAFFKLRLRYYAMLREMDLAARQHDLDTNKTRILEAAIDALYVEFKNKGIAKAAGAAPKER